MMKIGHRPYSSYEKTCYIYIVPYYGTPLCHPDETLEFLLLEFERGSELGLQLALAVMKCLCGYIKWHCIL